MTFTTFCEDDSHGSASEPSQEYDEFDPMVCWMTEASRGSLPVDFSFLLRETDQKHKGSGCPKRSASIHSETCSASMGECQQFDTQCATTEESSQMQLPEVRPVFSPEPELISLCSESIVKSRDDLCRSPPASKKRSRMWMSPVKLRKRQKVHTSRESFKL